MHNYKHLKIWVRSMDLSEMIYRETVNFPSNEKSQNPKTPLSIVHVN